MVFVHYWSYASSVTFHKWYAKKFCQSIQNNWREREKEQKEKQEVGDGLSCCVLKLVWSYINDFRTFICYLGLAWTFFEKVKNAFLMQLLEYILAILKIQSPATNLYFLKSLWQLFLKRVFWNKFCQSRWCFFDLKIT